MRTAWLFIKDTFKSWRRSDPAGTGAALSYYVLFSLPPIIVILIATAGSFLNRASIETRVIRELQDLVGVEGAELLRNVAQQIHHSHAGVLAGIISAITVLLGSIGAFSQIESVLNRLWNVPATDIEGVKTFIKSKLLALAMIFVLGFLLVLSLTLTTLISIGYSFIEKYVPFSSDMLQIFNALLSLILAAIIFMFVYAFLPEVKISRSAILLGGAITGILFMFGRFLIQLYLNMSLASSAYGAASAIIIILLWAFYSAQVFLLGAACTYTIDQRLKTD